MVGLRENLKVGFTKVTTTICRKLIKEVTQKEHQYWKEDAAVDAKNVLNEVETIENYFDVEEGIYRTLIPQGHMVQALIMLPREPSDLMCFGEKCPLALNQSAAIALLKE